MVKNLITIQESYINSYHPDFMGGTNSIMTLFDPGEFNKREEKYGAKKRMQMESIDENEPESLKKKK